MHIAFLTPEYPHKQFGASAGLGTSIQNLARSLVEKGIKVTLFVYGQKEKNVFYESGINFIGIKQIQYRFLGWYLYRKHLQKVVNETIKKEKIDLVEVPDWTGITAFINLRSPLIIRLHGSDAYFCKLEGRKQKYKNRLFEQKALKDADHLISVSEYAAKLTKEIFGLKSNLEVIPNSISLNEFSIPANVGLVQNRILYFGSLIRKKGVLELAEIFNLIVKQNNRAELLLIGKDVIDIFEKVSTLELFKKKLSPEALLSIKHMPEIPYQEIKKYIASAQVVALPSFAEALPMTWLEAMAMEKPLVTSNIGWTNEIMIDGITGYTVSPMKHDIFANRVLDLLANPEKAQKMGKMARDQIKDKFSTSIVVERNISFYSEVISKRKEY